MPVKPPEQAIGDAILKIGIEALGDRRTAHFAQHELRPPRLREQSDRGEAGEIEIRFGAHHQLRLQAVKQAAQPRHGVADTPPRDHVDRNCRVENRSKAALGAKCENGYRDPRRMDGIGEENAVALRAAACEGAYHESNVRPGGDVIG